MRNIELIIDGKKVDIDKSVTIPLTLRFEDLQNPTAIKNTFSKTVSLPATNRNNDIFNHIWNLDQQILNFNPRVRTPFVLLSGGTLIESGYIEMNSITYKGPYPSKYNITLYGGLFDFFYSLSEDNLEDVNDAFKENFRHSINADKVKESWTNDYYKYILSYSGQYNNFENDKVFERYTQVFPYGLVELQYDPVINASVGLYLRDNGLYGLVKIKYGSNPEIVNTNIPISFSTFGAKPRIIFDPNGGRFIIFNPGNGTHALYYCDRDDLSQLTLSFLVPPSQSQGAALVDINIIDYTYQSDEKRNRYGYLFSNGYAAFEGDFLSQGYHVVNIPTTINVESRMLINSFGPASSGYVRSGGIITKCGASGNQVYRIQTSGNPALTSSVYLLQEIVFQEGSAAEKILPNIDRSPGHFSIAEALNVVTFTFNDYNSEPTISRYSILDRSAELLYSSRRSDSKAVQFFGKGNGLFASQTTNPSTNALVTVDSFSSNLPGNHFETTAISYEGSPYINDGKYIISWVDDEDVRLSYVNGFTPSGNWEDSSGYYIVEDTEEKDEHQRLEFRSYYQRPCIRLKHLFSQICTESDYDVQLDPVFFNDNNPYWEKTWIMMDRIMTNQSDLEENRYGNIRSDDEVTFDLMIKNGISQKDFIVNYCKLFGLQLEKDKVKKKIYIWDRKTFFSQYKIVDWTNKIDYSKESTLDPLVFNYKHAVMKYADSGTQYETDYQSKYNREYGRLRLDTGYDFNSNTKNLIENNIFQNIVVSQDYDLYFEGRNEDFEHRDDKILPAAYTKKNNIRENTDLSMVLLFDAGMQQLDQPIRISDDSKDMENAGWYSWTRLEGIIVDSIPLMTRLINYNGEVYSLDFAKPSQIYYPLQNEETEYPEDSTIYGRYWQEFLDERLSDKTRTYTAYFYLTESEINQFRFNWFVKIKDTLWHVNKISDFDMTKEKSTKVELVRIGDIKNYGIEIFFFDVKHDHPNTIDEVLHLPNEGGQINLRVNSSHPFTIKIK